MKHRIKTLTPWILLAPLLLFLSYGPANSAITTGSGVPITGAASTIATADLTASRVLVSNSSGKVAVSTVTSTTLGYLDIGSSLTTLLSGKAASSHTHDVSDISGIMGSTQGGTGNGFTKFTGPTTAEKTFTLPNASATILTDNALVTAAQGGTGNGFTAFTGPTTSTKTFTLPNASATILTDNAAVTVAQGGTGLSTLTAHYVPVGNGTSAPTLISPSTAGYVLTSNGTGSDPSFQAASGSFSANINGGRLTLVTATPVMTSTQSAKTTLYYAFYTSNQITLWNGSAWQLYTMGSEPSLSLSGYTANKNYDIWMYQNSGTPTLESTVWTNDTTRATALAYSTGVLTKSGDATRKYLGTIRINNTGGQCDWIYGAVAANGTAADLGVWNYYNRVDVSTMIGDSTDSWTYTSSTLRAANNSSTMRAKFVEGVQEDPIKASYGVYLSTSASNVSGGAAIGIDSTTAYSGRIGTANVAASVIGEYQGSVAPGYHYASALEVAGSATVTYYGDAGVSFAQNGLIFNFRM